MQKERIKKISNINEREENTNNFFHILCLYVLIIKDKFELSYEVFDQINIMT